MSFVYERPDADIIDGEWRDEAQGQTLFDNLNETTQESSVMQPVVLLCHFDGDDGATTTTDSSPSAHTFTFGGNAQLDTAQFKFGTASLRCDGTSDGIVINDNLSDFSFGVGDFTIDFWFRINSDTGSPQYFFDHSGGSNNLEIFLRETDLRVEVTVAGGTVITGANGRSLSTWYHCAVIRSSGSMKLFINGIQDGSTYASSENITCTAASIGVVSGGSSFSVDGWIDEYRVVKGEALVNIALPTSAYTISDRDYIISSPNPSADMCRIRLSDQSGTSPATVRYQYGRRGDIETNLTVRLKQGTTVIQEWSHDDIQPGLYTASQLLDASAAALITDYSDLQMEFEATEPWWL